MTKAITINVKGSEIAVSCKERDDYISLTNAGHSVADHFPDGRKTIPMTAGIQAEDRRLTV